MRSGLAMLDGKPFIFDQFRASHLLSKAMETLLPDPVSIHHLGLFREHMTLQPVEYYNNLPFERPSSSVGASTKTNIAAASLAILVDPVIATGGTAAAAIQTLREWGVDRIILISVLGSAGGVKQAAEEWAEGVEVWVGGLDEELNDEGMIKPGLGDIGDRLFLTKGK